MKIKTQVITLLFGLLCCSPIAGQNTLLLETDFDGKVISGSKEALIEEISTGSSIRIGWELDFNDDNKPDLAHWADAEFITILNGEVFSQIRNINLQSPKSEIPQVDIIPENIMWTAILGTNSILKNRFVYDGELKYEVDVDGNPVITEELERDMKRREVQSWKVTTRWVLENR